MTTADATRRFRVHGSVGTPPEAVLLRDLDAGTAIWGTLADAGGRTVWPGMLVRGRAVETEHCHRLSEWAVEETSSLAVARCRDGVPETVWDAWEQRTAGQRSATTVLPGPCEIHVTVPPPRRSVEAVFGEMLTGAFSFEPWFEGLVELDGPATHLTVVSPTDRSPFVLFATPGGVPLEQVHHRREALGIQPFVDDEA